MLAPVIENTKTKGRQGNTTRREGPTKNVEAPCCAEGTLCTIPSHRDHCIAGLLRAHFSEVLYFSVLGGCRRHVVVEVFSMASAILPDDSLVVASTYILF